MTSKIDDLKDKIFDLEMEQKELFMQLDSFEMENKFYMDCDMLGGVDTSEVEKLIEENQCWLEYYKQELLDLQNTEKHGE